MVAERPDGRAVHVNRAPTFFQWLFWQRENDDPVIRRVAGWVYADRYIDCWPHRANTLSHLAEHLATEHDPATAISELDLRTVHDAWRAFREAGGSVPVRLGGIVPKPPNTKRRGYRLRLRTIDRIKRLAGHSRMSQAGLLEDLVDAEWGRRYGGGG